MEPTSEQELKQLLEDGNITEEEYQQLLEAMKSKHCSDNQMDQPKLSPKKSKARAIMYTFMIAISLWMFFLIVTSQTLTNKRIVMGVNLAWGFFAGINALRYWIVYWTYKDTLS